MGKIVKFGKNVKNWEKVGKVGEKMKSRNSWEHYWVLIKSKSDQIYTTLIRFHLQLDSNFFLGLFIINNHCSYLYYYIINKELYLLNNKYNNNKYNDTPFDVIKRRPLKVLIIGLSIACFIFGIEMYIFLCKKFSF